MHGISALIFEHWAVVVDTVEPKVVDDDESRWSPEKLNFREVLLLLGLCVQSSSEETFAIPTPDKKFALKANNLLKELHDAMSAEAFPKGPDELSCWNFDDKIGFVAREAVFYGADSFYYHQLAHYSRLRYKADSDWLLANVGISIKPTIDIAKFISDRVSLQMTAVSRAKKSGKKVDETDLTNSLLISKSELVKKFGEKSKAFVSAYSVGPTSENAKYVDPFSYNEIRSKPLIDFGEFIYVASVRALFESIYESPFYWMLNDPTYKDQASVNRGTYLEATASHLLQRVFGKSHVHKNVVLRSNGNVVGEIDVLVRYGDYLIIVQAKSKRLTLQAASGDAEALKSDFIGAINHPYDQAINCINAIRSGCNAVDNKGTTIDLASNARFFPLVVISDQFPAASFLANELLVRTKDFVPAIWDIGVLDCVCRILPNPIEFLFFLKSRIELFDKVIADSEHSLLGFHLRAKLFLPKDTDFMQVHADFSGVIDDYMVPFDLGMEPERPLGVLESLEVPIASELVKQLKHSPPEMAALAVDIYEFSQKALEDISRQIRAIRNELKLSTKVLKSVSVLTASGGLTFVCVKEISDRSLQAAEDIGRKHKYENKADKWFVVVDLISSDLQIDAFLPLNFTWAESQDEADLAIRVETVFATRKVSFN